MAPATRPDDGRLGPHPNLPGQPKRGRPRQTDITIDRTSEVSVGINGHDTNQSLPSGGTSSIVGTKRPRDKNEEQTEQLQRRPGPEPKIPAWCSVPDGISIGSRLRDDAVAATRDNQIPAAIDEDIRRIVENKQDEWRELWVMMLHIFNCTPHDLFTWGLRDIEGTSKLYWALCKVLPHPFWVGDISKLRYVLQKAVCFRSPGHLEPIGPLPDKVAQGIMSCPGNFERATMALHMWDGIKMDHEVTNKMVLENLRAAQSGRLAHGDYIRFHLVADDVVAIQQVLDTLAFRFATWHTVGAHYDQYVVGTRELGLDLPPRDRHTMKQWDLWSLIIRHVEATRGPDCPRFDRDFCEDFPYWDSGTCDPRLRDCMFAPEHIGQKASEVGADILGESQGASKRDREASDDGVGADMVDESQEDISDGFRDGHLELGDMESGERDSEGEGGVTSGDEAEPLWALCDWDEVEKEDKRTLATVHVAPLSFEKYQYLGRHGFFSSW